MHSSLAKKIGLAVAVTALAGGLAGCGNGNSAGNGNPTPSHQPPSTPQTGTVPKGPGGVGS